MPAGFQRGSVWMMQVRMKPCWARCGTLEHLQLKILVCNYTCLCPGQLAIISSSFFKKKKKKKFCFYIDVSFTFQCWVFLSSWLSEKYILSLIYSRDQSNQSDYCSWLYNPSKWKNYLTHQLKKLHLNLSHCYILSLSRLPQILPPTHAHTHIFNIQDMHMHLCAYEHTHTHTHTHISSLRTD